MTNDNAYEVVLGLEVHAQLLTKSKLFCGDSARFGASPNTQVSPITLGHPGTLPKMNRNAVGFAIKLGLACECEIEKRNYFARKNYFYPDLPKNYQVTQHTTPVCKGGSILIKTTTGEKNIRLNRIHIEEDAGKSLHDADPENTCIDYNRAGAPLLEIVSEPDLRSADEAFAYVNEIRKLVRYLDICDGNMEEGSLRCDANISVRKKGDQQLGVKVEIKNLNSVRNIKRAIESEALRQISILQEGGKVLQETRGLDEASGRSFATREKEDADDYRYFPEPDLPPFQLEDEFIEQIRQGLPVLQTARIKKYTSLLHLSEYDAAVLSEERAFADYFESVTGFTGHYKAAANWMLGPVRSWLNERHKEINDFPLAPEQIAAIILLVETGKLSFSAATRMFAQWLTEPGRDPAQLAEEMNLIQQSDAQALEPIIDEVLKKYADKVQEYKKGKKGLLALFVGEVMKISRGKADPKKTQELLVQKIKNIL